MGGFNGGPYMPDCQWDAPYCHNCYLKLPLDWQSLDRCPACQKSIDRNRLIFRSARDGPVPYMIQIDRMSSPPRLLRSYPGGVRIS